MTSPERSNLSYPTYYDQIPPIRMQDNLAKTLGAAEGCFDYYFIDVVKSAGHSCPSVAGAWMQTVVALRSLYGQETPIRGRLHVTIKGSEDDGHSGAIANVISLITGATNKQGFGGIFAQADSNRQGLLTFANQHDDGPLYTIFTILDEQQNPIKSVKVSYNPRVVAPDRAMMPLAMKMKSGLANEQEKAQFAGFWQERVQRIMIDNFVTKINDAMLYVEALDRPVI